MSSPTQAATAHRPSPAAFAPADDSPDSTSGGTRWTAVFAIGAVAFAVAVVAVRAYVAIRLDLGVVPPPIRPDVSLAGLTGSISDLAYVAVGALLIWRVPRNAVGWVLIAGGLGYTIEKLIGAYASYGLWASGVDLPATEWAAWSWSYSWVVPFPLIVVVLPIIFPDGRLPSRRWWLAIAAIVALSAVNVAQSLAQEQVLVGEVPVAENPAAVLHGDVLQAVLPPVLVLFFPLIVAVAAAPLLRYRRGGPVERRQLRWFLYTVVLMMAGFPLSAAGILDRVPMLERISGVLVFSALPISVGIAVTRYRLYEIDRIIRRSVSYALLSVVLVALYAAGVLLLGSAVRLVTGEAGGDLVVAASTLAVAAAFGPLRRRVQILVDRRFDRARYDAQRTADRFGQRLRDEVDLDSLRRELVDVVQGTVRPTRVSVWLPG